MTAPGATPATISVEDFLAQVGQACADLPEPARARLIADLELHLRELDEPDLAELGDPVEYARELRAALNLPTSQVDTAMPAGPATGRTGTFFASLPR